MRRLLKYTAILLMVLMASSSVWAYSYCDHVTTAPNNKGDVLIYPWYLALDGGWQTKLTVINTDLENAVVAKVVIRSMKNSEELIDFFSLSLTIRCVDGHVKARWSEHGHIQR